jgi:hypothetical protein
VTDSRCFLTMSRRPNNPLDTTLPSSDSEPEQEALEDVVLDIEASKDETIDPQVDLNPTFAVEALLLEVEIQEQVIVPQIVPIVPIIMAAAAPSRWLTAGRSDVEAAGMAVAVRKEDRSGLSADALLKLQRSSTEGMTHKFFLMGNSKEDQLVQCYNLLLRVEELRHSCRWNTPESVS